MTSPTPYYFAGTNINDCVNYFLLSKQLDMPEVKESLQKIAHLDGMKVSGININERQIQLRIGIISNASPPTRADLESKIDALDKVLALKQQSLQLHALDSRAFTADCISAKVNFDGSSPIKAVMDCVFLCAIPYAYASSASNNNVASASLTNVSGNIYQYASQTFVGGGTAIALPTITLTNTTTIAWTQVQITEVTDNRTLTITSNLPQTTNDYLIIYCDPNNIPSSGYSIMKNGSVACAFNGVFPVLQPTSTQWTIQVTVASGTPHGSAQWAWNARYMR